MFILYDFNYNTRADLSLTSAEYCIGASPTAGIPTFDEVSDVSLCEDVTLTLSSTFACRACSTMKAETAPLTESYQDGDYLEVLFLLKLIDNFISSSNSMATLNSVPQVTREPKSKK